MLPITRAIATLLPLLFFPPLLCMENGSRPQHVVHHPLAQAAATGDLESPQMLLHHNYINLSCNEDGATPLMIAAQNGHDGAVALLLEKKADPDQPAFDNHRRPLTIAFKNIAGNDKRKNIIASLLHAKANPHYCTNPLHQSSQESGAVPITRLLLEANLDPNMSDVMGKTPLHIACEDNSADHLMLLIYARANVNARSGYHRMKKATEPLRFKLPNGQHVVQFDVPSDVIDSNITPLHVASKNNSTQCIEILLQKGALDDINVGNRPDNTTPLMAAVQNNHYGAAKILLAYGAEQTYRDAFQKRAIDYATTPELQFLLLSDSGDAEEQKEYDPELSRGVQKIFDQTVCDRWFTDSRAIMKLVLAGGNPNAIRTRHGTSSILNFACDFNHRGVKGMVDCLLAYGADPNAGDEDHRPLFSAHSAEMVDLLVKHKADIHHRNSRGSTLLHVAEHSSRKEVLAKLLQLGLNPNEQNNYGKTPLHSCLDVEIHPYDPKIVESALENAALLLHAGASPTIIDHAGETPFTWLQNCAERERRIWKTTRWQTPLEKITAIDEQAQKERSELHATLESHLPCKNSTDLSRIITAYSCFLMHESLCEQEDE